MPVLGFFGDQTQAEHIEAITVRLGPKYRQFLVGILFENSSHRSEKSVWDFCGLKEAGQGLCIIEGEN